MTTAGNQQILDIPATANTNHQFMNQNFLRTTLANAVRAQSDPGYTFTALEVDNAENNPEAAEPRTTALLAALAAEPALQVFHEKVHIIGGTAHIARRRDLAQWLIRRATVATPDQALSDLAMYMTAKVCECVHTLVFQGQTPEAACEFDGKITLQPWETFPDPAEKHRIELHLAGHPTYPTFLQPPYQKATGALVASVTGADQNS